MTVFGQVVVGPPGSGKSTYCLGLQQFYKGMGRPCAIINLDPANDKLPYEAAVNITELTDAGDAAKELGLGPNGSLMYCMSELEANVGWLVKKARALRGQYLLFDFPGQVELFTHSGTVRSIVQQLVKHDFRLTAVNLVDSHYCQDHAKYISVVMLSLNIMLQLELPHVNVLSKMDLIEAEGPLEFPLETFTEVLDPERIVDSLESDPRTRRYAKLSRAIATVLEDYSFVQFHVLNIQDKESVLRIAREVDKSNGYSYADADLQKFLTAQVSDHMREPDWNVTVRERYISDFTDVPRRP